MAAQTTSHAVPQAAPAARSSGDAGSRLFIVVLSVVALSAILGLVEALIPRMILGALVMGFLTWSAYTSASQPRTMAGPPSGVRERRRNHTLRHRVNEFLRGVRRLDGIARDTREGFVKKETAEKALAEIDRGLHELARQIRFLAGRAA